MADLQDLIKIWFHDSPHTASWLLSSTQFVARESHRSQKGYIFILHDGVEFMRWHQYGGGRGMIRAADPRFFDKLDRILKELTL